MIENPDIWRMLTSICERLSSQTVRLRIVELTESDPPGPTMAQLAGGEGKEQRLDPLRASAGASGRQAGAGDVRRRARRGQTGVEPEGGRGMKNPFGNMGNILEASAGDAGANGEGTGTGIASKTVTGTAGRWQRDGHGQWGYAACRHRHRSRSGRKVATWRWCKIWSWPRRTMPSGRLAR